MAPYGNQRADELAKAIDQQCNFKAPALYYPIQVI